MGKKGRFGALASLALVGVCGVAASACSSRGPRAPEGTETPAAHSLLGTEPDFAAVVRLDRVRNDLVYAPMLREMANKKDLDALFNGVTIIDGFGTFDGTKPTQASLVLTVRSAPPLNDWPKDWRNELEKHDVGHQLPSGVWEFATIGSDGWPYGLYGMQHDFVFLSGRAAGHGHDWFSTNVAPPPAVDFGDDVLVGFWMGPHTMKSAAMAEWTKEPGSKGLESASVILRDGAHGDLLYTGIYATSADASEALRVTTDQLGMYASVWKSAVDKCPGLSALSIENESDGRTVRIRVTHIPQGIRAAMDCESHDAFDKM